MRVWTFVCVVAAFGLAIPAFADDSRTTQTSADASSPAKLELATRLLKATGGADAMMSNLDEGIDGSVTEQKKRHPEVSDKFWDEFKVEFKAYMQTHQDDMIRLVASAYAERLSEEELKDAVTFYETGVGKKLADPALEEAVKKSSETWGEQVGEQIGEQVMKKLQTESSKK